MMTIQIEVHGCILNIPIQITSHGSYNNLVWQVKCVNTDEMLAFVPLVIDGGKDLKPMLQNMKGALEKAFTQIL
jgi:hypothetical protein